MFSIQNKIPDYSILNSTHIVADLECKRFVQEFHLTKSAGLPEDACLRASEFWQKLLFSVAPEKRIISPSLAQSVVREYLDSRSEDWVKGPGISKIVLKYVEFFLPIFVHPQGVELVGQWLTGNKSALLRWGNWFSLSHEVFKWFQEKNWTLSKWAPAELQAYVDEVAWPRNLIIDLGADFSALEIQILQKIAKQKKVTIVSPDSNWISRYHRVLWPYQLAAGEPVLTPNDKKLLPDLLPQVILKTYATRLSEVKAAISQTREWLDQGIKPKDIYIFASDVENYWPVLSSYLHEEGIPVAKSSVAVVASLPSIGQWLSRLRIETGQMTSEDIESAIFSNDVLVDLNYTKFRNLFSNLMEPEELHRFEKLLQVFDLSVHGDNLISRDEFLAFSLSKMSTQVPTEALQIVISRILLECGARHRMRVRTWISYLSGVISRSEFPVENGEADGIRVRKLESGHKFSASHVIILGLTDRALSENSETHITLNDVLKLGNDLGFFLDRPEAARGEFLADWIAHQPLKTCVLSHAVTDFEGQAEAPALFWLGHAAVRCQSLGELSGFGSTVWDQVQNQSIETLSRRRERDEPSAKLFLKTVEQDLGLAAHDLYAVGERPSLSANSIKKYFECPFRFAASKLFGIYESPELDLDLDRMRRGQLIHRVFESILEGEFRRTWTDAELIQIIRKAKVKEGILLDGYFWERSEREALEVARKFIQFEMAWRTQFPQTKTVGCEVEFKGQWHNFELTGFIDRIDQDSEGRSVLVDYKSSKSQNYSNHSGWIKKGEMQLLFYIKAMQSGWTQFSPGIVDGALYFFIKNWQRDTGLVRAGIEPRLVDPTSKKATQISEDGLAALMADFEKLFLELTHEILDGKYAPVPRDTKTCKECEWKTLCRAPHLN